jgi:hypothetical protein
MSLDLLMYAYVTRQAVSTAEDLWSKANEAKTSIIQGLEGD